MIRKDLFNGKLGTHIITWVHFTVLKKLLQLKKCDPWKNHESHQRGEATFVLFNLVSSNFHYQNRNTEITRPVPGHIPLLLQSRCWQGKRTLVIIDNKSQQALQLQREQNRLERKSKSREQKRAEEKRRFELKQQKRKNKHRGRWCPWRLFQRHITEKKKRKIEIWFLRQRD